MTRTIGLWGFVLWGFEAFLLFVGFLVGCGLVFLSFPYGSYSLT